MELKLGTYAVDTYKDIPVPYAIFKLYMQTMEA